MSRLKLIETCHNPSELPASLLPFGSTRAAVATAAALSALLAEEQLAVHQRVTNDCEDLLVFLLEFLRFRFSRMVSFASNKAFFAAASACTAGYD
jgi:hypothetical protein